jgi:16S rRNA processing protein RimM
VRYFAEGPENLLEVRRAVLARGEADPEARSFDVRSVAPGRPGELRLELDGVRTREAALALRGRLVFVAPGELRPLAPGEYYGYELLGCRVEGLDGAPVGIVREIWETGASDLLVVEGERGARHLLPAALLRRLERGERRIAMEIPPGILDGE